MQDSSLGTPRPSDVLPATNRASAADVTRRSLPWGPAAAVSAGLLAWVVWMVYRASRLNGGPWIYPLDDLYIHLSAVKQLVGHHVWGVSYLDGFSSCLSSLLYPLLLVGGSELFGLRAWLPLALNLLASVGVIFYAATILGRYTRSAGLTLLVLGVATVCTPLPVVAATGMEHVWQTLADLFFIDLVVRTLTAEDARLNRRAAWLLPLAAGLVTAIRFEGLFVISIVGLLLLCRGRFWLAVGIGVGAALPLAVFGAYSVSQGSFPLPNSVLLKGEGNFAGVWFGLVTLAGFAAAGRPRWAVGVLAVGAVAGILAVLLPPSRHWLMQGMAEHRKLIGAYAHMTILTAALAATLAWAWGRRGLWTAPVLWPGIVLVVTLQHLTFAKTGWVYRYEAYTIFLSFLAGGVVAAEAFPAGGVLAAWRRQPWVGQVAAALVVAAVGVPLVARAGWATHVVVRGSHDIYRQQYQMGRFVREFYEGDSLAANDIGAINYLADVRTIDTFGLATYEVCRARRAGTYGQESLRALLRARQAHLVIVYDLWASMYGGVLPEWVPVGRWQMPGNIVCGSDTVTFYAPDAASAPRLTEALQRFAPELPPDVVQSGAYVDRPAVAVAAGGE